MSNSEIVESEVECCTATTRRLSLCRTFARHRYYVGPSSMKVSAQSVQRSPLDDNNSDNKEEEEQDETNMPPHTSSESPPGVSKIGSVKIPYHKLEVINHEIIIKVELFWTLRWPDPKPKPNK